MRRVLVPALVALAVVATAGCTPADEPSEPSVPQPLSRLSADAVSITPGGFCDAVGSEAVAAAVSTRKAEAASYGPGDRVPLTDEVTDVANEYGCTWTAPDGEQARAWVFATPTSTRDAAALARAMADEHGCRSTRSQPLGQPSAAVACRADDTGTSGVTAGTTVRIAGLLGSTWLTCETTASGTGTGARRRQTTLTERWCAEVVAAARS